MCAMSSERDQSARNPEDLERQADAIRADMDRTLNALERKLSPEQLLDRPLSFLKEHGGELRQTLGATMRNNPVPIVLTLAGITWLVAASYNKRQPPGQDLQSRFAHSSVGQKLQARASRARERLHSATESARERFRSTQESGEFDELQSSDEEYGQTGGARERLSSKLSSTRETARTRAHQAQDRLYSMLDEQPLVLGALAVAIGAIIGTAVPSTHYENRMLGRARERAMTKAQELGEQRYEELRETLQSSGTQEKPDTESPLTGRA